MKYFVEDTSLTAVADAIRAKTGDGEQLVFPEGFTQAISTMTTEPLLLPAEFPDHVRLEAAEVAEKVRGVLTDDSVVFIVLSDTHYYGDEGTSSQGFQTNESGLRTAMAVKALTYLLPVDFVGHLGDVAWGGSSTTPDTLKAQIKGFLDYLNDGRSTLPVFIAIGNHDAGIYYHDAQTDGAVHTLTGGWLYDNFTAYSHSDQTVFSGEENGGYCYRDFSDKKLRVFLLNSAEKIVTEQIDGGTLPSQQLWVANALKELGEKEDAAQWSFLVLCHYPLDYGEHRPMSNVFKAYVNGESIDIAVDGVTTSVDFSGCNGAKFAAQFHGHTHCFRYARLNGYDSSGTMTEYDAWRIAVPNGQFDRENYYVNPYYGIYFCEDTSYPKTADTAEETSFVVNVFNPGENAIHSFCYGAGYDRSISLDGIAYYSIISSLTYATLEGSGTSVKEGETYSGTITVNEGCTLQSVVVTMGGVDVTAEVYSAENGTINIPSVTGTVTITVVAKAPAVNLIPLSVEEDGSLYNGGIGYKEGYRISTSGSGEKELDGSFVSGFIPADVTADTLILENVGTAAVSGTASYLIGFRGLNNSLPHGQLALADLTPNEDGSLTVTPEIWAANTTTQDPELVTHVRLSCSYLGAASAVYKD